MEKAGECDSSLKPLLYDVKSLVTSAFFLNFVFAR